jgi:hypothetical protein
MKTLVFSLALIQSISVFSQTVTFDENYREVVIAKPARTLTLDANTATLLLNAETITLQDGTIINIKKPANFKADPTFDISTLRGIQSVVLPEGGSGTGGGG